MVSSSVSIEGGATPIEGDPEAGPRLEPPRGGRWLLVAALAFTFIVALLAASFTAISFMISTGAITPDQLRAAEFQTTPQGIEIALGATAVAEVATILVALLWPWVWSKLAGRKSLGLTEWLAWRKPMGLPLWAAAVIAPLIMLPIGILVGQIFGESQVDTQVQMFSSPFLRVAASIIVVLIAPPAEEFMFRGALYNALLPRQSKSQADGNSWQRHIIPFVIVSISFALIHLLADFTRVGSIILIFALSFVLTGMRAYTGSTRASVIAHMTWNGLAAVALISQNILNLPQ